MKELLSCPNCKMIFTKTSNFNRHLDLNNCKLRSSTDIILFETEKNKCEYCSKIFSKNGRLKKHLSSK
jgi:uncharacterized C2H2 Zn-finger protein